MDTTPRSPHADTSLADRRARVGRLGEDLAAVWMAVGGFDVLDRNWRLASGELRGELDLVCRDGDTLVVVEVKTRRSDRFGGPLLAVTPDKQARIRALAAAYLRVRRPGTARVRFDVIGVSLDAGGAREPDIEHVAGAF